MFFAALNKRLTACSHRRLRAHIVFSLRILLSWTSMNTGNVKFNLTRRIRPICPDRSSRRDVGGAPPRSLAQTHFPCAATKPKGFLIWIILFMYPYHILPAGCGVGSGTLQFPGASGTCSHVAYGRPTVVYPHPGASGSAWLHDLLHLPQAIDKRHGNGIPYVIP